jgi:hypothetical protein
MPNEPKKNKCPHCGAFIEEVDYFCYTSGKEWGKADINIEDGYFETTECNDSEITDSSDYEYTCPECKHSVDIDDFDNEEEEEEDPELNEDGQPLIANTTQTKLSELLLPEDELPRLQESSEDEEDD